MHLSSHEKITRSVQQMLVDTRINLPYYGNFNLFINFHERPNLSTCAVNITASGMNFYYNSDFLNRLSQKEVNFVVLHENFHLVWNHPQRTVSGRFDHKLANIAQDMIINHVIWEDIGSSFVEIPKDENGKNMALFVPQEYNGRLIFEELYLWLRDEKEKRDRQKNSVQGQGKSGNEDQENQKSGGAKSKSNKGGDKQNSNQDGDGQNGEDNDNQEEQKPKSSGKGKGKTKGPDYGPFGKNPRAEESPLDTWSLDSILDNLDKDGDGQYLDQHIPDEIPEDLRESLVKEAIERALTRSRSMLSNPDKITQTLDKLRKKRKDYLKHIKRSLANLIFGNKKTKTIIRLNRRGIEGIKGHRKVKTKINCILDTSGSMGGTFEKVLSFIYRNDIEVNLIEADTNVKLIQTIKSKRKLQSLPIKGLGGTILQPGIDLVADKFNEFNTLVLTDGYCDHLDVSKLKGNVLMISIGQEVPIEKTNGRLKQIVVELEK